MDVLTFLKSIRREFLEIESTRNLITDLRMKLLPSGIRYDTAKVQTSPSDKMSDDAARLVEAERILSNRTDRLCSHIILAEELIDMIQEPEYRELLQLRYMKLGQDGRSPVTWKEVADVMHYHEVYVKGELHGKAIKEARTVWQHLGVKLQDVTQPYGDI